MQVRLELEVDFFCDFLPDRCVDQIGEASINRHAENILTHSCYATAGQCTSVEGSNPS
jgi:hypothetical protein